MTFKLCALFGVWPSTTKPSLPAYDGLPLFGPTTCFGIIFASASVHRMSSTSIGEQYVFDGNHWNAKLQDKSSL